MSKENESIVLFAMSLSPKRISKVFFHLSGALSLLLLINAIFLIPISKQLGKNFLQQKKLEAKINIKESEFGQKFASWNVFVNRLDGNDRYENIVLYERDPKSKVDTFILANGASIDKDSSRLELDLKSGSVYSFKDDELKQIDYEKLRISYNPETKEIRSDAIFEYWYQAINDKKRARNLSLAILVALFPFASYLFAVSFGIANLRHESPNIYLNMFLVILLYYFVTYQVATKIPLVGTGLVFILFFIASVVFFKRKVLVRY
jgi:lipopolysaccharide export system permease protein